ncbi:MAG: phospholipase C, phosphocholine-specific [Bacteroidetes bacterium]|nr:phospholipase C, phosphocholine-specific [Bacteroidota bacterium]
MSDTRRDFLKKTALLTGAAGLAQLLPESIQRALAIDPPKGSTWQDAEHVVILMQENRSFDHALGTLRGVRGYNDPRAIRLPNRNLVWLQSNAAGETYAPFRLDINQTKATWMHSLPHSWSNQVNARNDGKHDQWLNVKQNSTPEYAHMPLTMGYHTREDLPFYYSLADAFTVCDQNFCSSLTGTNPNRLYFWTGTVREQQHEGSRAHVWNDDMDYGTLKWTTFPERLEALGISWKCYQNEMSIDTGFKGEEDPWLSNFQDNPLEFFAQYNIQLHKRHIEFLKEQKKDLPKGASWDQLSSHHQALHRKAFNTNTGDPHYHQLDDLSYNDGGTERTMKAPKGDVLHQFRQDVQSGKLPMVSWLSAPENFSDHPSAPWYGAWYVSEVMEILTKNPEVWKKTIFILAYDENDGYFDHVAPFTAPHSQRPDTGKVSAGIDTRVDFITEEQEKERNGFPEKFGRESSIGLGFRVPLVIASPWTRGGWVNSQVFDHTSTLQFLEKFLSHKTGHKVVEPNISDWRRLVCGDLTSVFRPWNGEKIASPAFLPRKEFLEGIHKAQFRKLPDTFKALSAEEITAFNNNLYASRQEPGTRPSCALPYNLSVEGRLSADKQQFEINFINSKSLFGERTVGAPFNVYAYGDGTLLTRAYGIRAGDRLSDVWKLDGKGYHLCVYGPNGFFREFRGDASDPAIDVRLDYLQDNGVLRLVNGGEACAIEIVDHAYGVSYAGARLKVGEKLDMSLSFGGSHGWYDFSVRVKGKEHFEKRYAGRIETGKDSISDPFMGRTVAVSK